MNEEIKTAICGIHTETVFFIITIHDTFNCHTSNSVVFKQV